MLPKWIKEPLEAFQRGRRNRTIFRLLDASGEGLDTGPCHNGIATKREGFRVKILDHMDQDGLRRKYQGHPGVDVSRIEAVDFIWNGEAYSEVVGEAKFDWIIASHVIEHVPDLVRFLGECRGLLRSKGRLYLVVPDCRRVFDRGRFPSGSGEVVDAHLRVDVRPTPGAVAEHHLRAVTKGGRLAWAWWWPGAYARIHTTAEVVDAFTAAREGQYKDIHVWRFTPDSFRALLDDLRRLGYLKMDIVGEIVASGSEFSVCLGLSE
jgi:SAM-dependent methyltransferase